MATTNEAPPAISAPSAAADIAVRHPRVAIQFCTQCRWMLRAAYFAQELLSTFGSALGEVALQPATGGIFRVTIETPPPIGEQTITAVTAPAAITRTLWDRKTEVGFPEVKELKRRVRDVIAPGRDLGHVDRTTAVATITSTEASPTATMTSTPAQRAPACEDCS